MLTVNLMKNLHTFIIVLFFSSVSFAQEVDDLKPEFKFISETINYGKITLGANGIRVFEFTNIGKSPLIITRVQASCGCTVPKKPDQPIMPGEKGEIEVAYDTKRPGGFSKAITIFSNAKNERKMVKIKGYIEKTTSLEKKKSILSENN
jgi:hypothetical protein|tara:strand:- start:465 stop:911 length:447 start_codon:yes stop_codon:yes gene_type:complete